MENFLLFLTQNNALVVEALVGLVALLAVVLGYKSFFTTAAHHSEALPASTKELELLLKKAIEQGAQQKESKKSSSAPEQSLNNKEMEAFAAFSGKTESPSSSTSGEGSEKAAGESDRVAEKDKLILALRAEIKELKSQPAAGGGENSAMSAELESLKERLSEYEIIADDIADLSKYRTENEELRQEIELLKKLQAEPIAMDEPQLEATELATSDELLEAVGNDETQAASEAPLEESPPEVKEEELIDDELMKEFQAAVEGQKAATQTATDESVTDNEMLLNEFESFISKKE